MTPRRLLRLTMLTLCPLVPAAAIVAQDELPQSLDPRLKIELFAEDPQIVTPTGIDIDHAGRIWAIESNTHFPPDSYQGHPTDRILVMEDTDQDHKADKIAVFKDGLTHTMSVAVKPVWLELAKKAGEQGSKGEGEKDKNKRSQKTLPLSHAPPLPRSVFIATRRELLLCTDTDGDLRCDETKQLVHLETTGNYPHNGLAGIAFDALGNMFFGFGENLGADYKIIGSDGTALSGGGEGGNVYRCRPDGSKLERWANGFWNPHASCFDAFGHMFTVDNDPDSRPPCRLLHIIPGGDYGYRFRNGRKGTHPFTSWNGEIPGTLPMVSGTGEAPSGIVCYESDGFPDDYLGTLLVGSWGDHRIDKFVLKPRGASFESLPQPVIKGGENFRPVGLALAPDGSLYVTDWVLKDYKLHGKGRVWRVSSVENVNFFNSTAFDAATVTAELPEHQLYRLMGKRRRDVRRTAAKMFLTKTNDVDALEEIICDEDESQRRRLEVFWLWLKAKRDNGDDISEDKIDYLVKGVWPEHWKDSMPRYVAESSVLLELGIEPLEVMKPSEVGDERYVHRDAVEVLLSTRDPFEFAAATRAISLGEASQEDLANWMKEEEVDWDAFKTSKGRFWHGTPTHHLSYLLAARTKYPKQVKLASIGIGDPSPMVRRAAVQWVGEENLKELRPEVEKVLASEPMTGDLFMACLASLSLLDSVPPAEFENAPPVQHILPIVKDANRSASVRAIALRVLPPSLTELDAKLLRKLVASTDESLRQEAVRTLAQSPISEREELLRDIAANESLDTNLRADAVAGLAGTGDDSRLKEGTRDLLINLLRDKNETLALEALRSLRGPATTNQDQPGRDPKVTDALKEFDAQFKTNSGRLDAPIVEALEFALGKRANAKLSQSEISNLKSQISNLATASPGDSEAGRRTFFHTNSAGCWKCHTVGGRGGQVGPDLTVIARTMDRQKLADSILEPSKEISPQFTAWAIATTSGKVLTGMLLGEEVNGDLRLGDNTGTVFFVPFNDIESRTPTSSSIMPDGLHQTLTTTELRDLIAYLELLK